MTEDLSALIERIGGRINVVKEIAGDVSILQGKQLKSLINDLDRLVFDANQGDTVSSIPERKIKILMDAVRLMISGKNADEILPAALSGAACITGAYSGAIVLRDEFHNSAFPAIKYPKDSSEEFPYSKTVVEKVLMTGEGVYEKNITNTSDFYGAGSIMRGGIVSVIAAPIQSSKEVIGVVYIDSRELGKDLDETDLPFLCDFATLASLLYENILLSERKLESLQKDRKNAYRVMVGKSTGMKHIDELIDRYAPLPRQVLITGETGTGKRVVAEEIHRRSKVPGPFIVMNCGGIPETLFEAEFFGYVKGAFTDAVKDHQGYIAQAQNGTLFLDEIGELTPGTQVKLLQFLDDKNFRRLGDEIEKKSNARIVLATHRNLQDLVSKNQFREDLYYRLNVLTIEIPPLRMRLGDIPDLASFFIRRECNNINKPVIQINDDVLKRLQMMPWSGNVREFKNLIERLVIHSDGNLIDIKALDNMIQPVELKKDFSAVMEDVTEDSVIITMRNRALELENGNCAAAARRLGISAPTLHKWMKKHGLK